MALTVYHDVDEDDVAIAIIGGDLRLEHILQYCLRDDVMVERLIKEMEVLGGTKDAGKRAAKFAEAMIEA